MLKAYKGIVVCLLLGGCYTQFKASNQVNKALARYPQVVAKIAQDSFPCDVIRIDTLISVNDTSFLIDCPVRDTVLNSVLNSVHDTLYKKLYVKLPYKTFYITKTVESTAKLAIIKASLDSAKNAICELQKSSDDLTSKVGRKNKVIYWLIAFLIGLCVPYVIRIVRYITL